MDVADASAYRPETLLTDISGKIAEVGYLRRLGYSGTRMTFVPAM